MRDRTSIVQGNVEIGGRAFGLLKKVKPDDVVASELLQKQIEEDEVNELLQCFRPDEAPAPPGETPEESSAKERGPRRRGVVFADAVGRDLTQERVFRRGEPLKTKHVPKPPPVRNFDLCSDATKALILKAAAATRASYARARDQALKDLEMDEGTL